MALYGKLEVVDDVAAAFHDLVVVREPASIALSGGDTARVCYERLVAAPVGWERVEFFMSDERWVPVSDPASNEGMARIALLDHIHPAAIHSMYRSDETIEDAAADYDALVRAHPPIELLHLGLGPDGHTASLFPGTAALDVRDRYVVPNGDDLHPYPRLTFTYPAISRSPLVVFTVAGVDKRDALAAVATGKDVPAARVRANEVLWLVDHEAASPGIG
ncbi:MAG: 6-phosphogluconolactonase, eukaryotic type [Actinomycetia bacterium]|nr:6-phosphogluconolactonase, eukaryotic type [Actinomycetes bacterium]